MAHATMEPKGPKERSGRHNMVSRARLLLLVAFFIAPSSPSRGEDPPATVPARPAWGEAMARVHARFRDKAGTFAHFGDSITETLAFWTPMKWDHRPD